MRLRLETYIKINLNNVVTNYDKKKNKFNPRRTKKTNK